MKSNITQRFEELKSLLEELQQEGDKARGAMQQLREELEKEVGSKSIKKAKRILHKLHQQQAESKTKIGKLLSELEVKWETELERIYE